MSGRTMNDRVDVSSLLESLRPYAKLKQPPSDWELSRYAKCRRSQAADRAGLITYIWLLTIIVDHAPKCLPPHVALRDVYLELQRDHGIKDPHLARQSDLSWADQCADAIKIAMKHLQDVAKSRSAFLPAPLKALVAKVRDCSSASLSVSPASNRRAKAPKPIDNAAPATPRAAIPLGDRVDSSSDAEVEDTACRCELCWKPEDHIVVVASQDDANTPPSAVPSPAAEPSPAVPSPAAEPSPIAAAKAERSPSPAARSDTSLLAAGGLRAVSAVRGGQKREALKKRPAAQAAAAAAKAAAAAPAAAAAAKAAAAPAAQPAAPAALPAAPTALPAAAAPPRVLKRPGAAAGLDDGPIIKVHERKNHQTLQKRTSCGTASTLGPSRRSEGGTTWSLRTNWLKSAEQASTGRAKKRRSASRRCSSRWSLSELFA